jgi:hypothetical protein
MIEPEINEVQQLIQQGRIAALAGDTSNARTHFRRAAELDSACAEVWVGLSGVVPVLAEKRDCLQRALALEPHNLEAQAGLGYVERLLAGGARIAPSQRAEPTSAGAEPLEAEAQLEPAVEYCYNHPERETGLHCVQCTQPICGTCARVAPVGQLCPTCRKVRRPQQYKVTSTQLLIAGAVALVGSALAAALFQFAGGEYMGFYIALFIAPLTAEMIVRLSDRLTRGKRGLSMQLTVGAAMSVGMLPFALVNLPLLFGLMNDLPEELAPVVFQPNPMLLVFLCIAVATAAARLR